MTKLQHKKKPWDILAINNLTISYNAVPIVQHFSCCLPRGAMVALMGPNGGGKSSLLKTLSGLHKEFTGKWAWSTDHLSTKSLRQNIAYLPQHHTIQRNFPLTVKQVVAMGRWKPHFFPSFNTKEDEHCITEALATVKMLPYKNHPLSSLSGGQFQRMLFARMLAQDASILLLDEPFSGMDEVTTDILLSVMNQWHHQEKTLIVAQHDQQKVRQHFPYTLLLGGHKHFCGHTEQVLTPEHWQEVYEAITQNR